MMRPTLIFLLLLWAAPAWADWLGCFEPSASVDGYTVQFSGTATSVSANVIDPDDTTTATATPAMAAVGSAATDLWSGASFSVGASPVYGVWTIQYVGTVNGSVVRGSDLFEVRATCPLRPSVAGSTIIAGNLDAAVTSRMATYTQPTGFLAATFPTTIPTAAQTSTATWDELTATARTAGSYGALLKAGGAGDLAAILADTNELQTDWVNGGRLDLLLDGIKLKTDFLPSATAGAAGGLFIAGANAATTVTGDFGIAVTIAAGNTDTWDTIAIDETTVITAAGDHVGKYLLCGKAARVIVATANGTPDTITVVPGNPFPSAPAGGTVCYLVRP